MFLYIHILMPSQNKKVFLVLTQKTLKKKGERIMKQGRRFFSGSGFGLIFDNLLGFSTQELRRLINLYALLYDRMLVSDSWTLTNAALKENLESRSGVELLRSGIIVPVRRDTMDSFAAFLVNAREKKMHGLIATDKYAALLDREARSEKFVMKVVADSYRQMSEAVLREETLVSLGISEESAALVRHLITEARVRGEATDTNSFLKDSVEPRLAQNERPRFWEIARAPYSLNLPAVLGSGIIGPKDFRGDQILAALYGGRKRSNIIVEAAGTSVSTGTLVYVETDPLACWILSEEVLKSITPEELAAARDTENRLEYLVALDAEVSGHTVETWNAYIAAFQKYFRTAGETVFRMRVHSDALETEPGEDASVEVESDGAIHIKPPSEHVLITAMPEEKKIITADHHIQVIGREVSIPEPK